MLITAHARTGTPDGRGVVGNAWSPDLDAWQVRPPRSEVDAGFSQLEVPQTAVVDGHAVLVFSCLGPELSGSRAGQRGGSWSTPADSVAGPFDVRGAGLLLDDRFYSARLIRDRAGQWQALAFHHTEHDGGFDGRLSDPMPVGWVRPGALGVH